MTPRATARARVGPLGVDSVLRIDRGSPDWPASLERVESPPEELWLRGRRELLGLPAGLAIVGSRSASPYGRTQAGRFAATCAAEGLVVVSGLARGIDQAAHEGALDAGGATVAFLGNGVDRPWPDGPLARRMAVEGLLVSEYPPGQGPRRHHFPLRNRLIAGLARAVLVVEAAPASGSLITARWALGQGKDVFALPGRVDNPLALGVLSLLREGATPVTSPAELLADLLGRETPPPEAARPAPGHPLLEALVGDTCSAAELAGRTGDAVPSVLAELAQLELSGAVVRTPGGLYRLGRAR